MYSRVAAAAEVFETGLASAEGARRSAAASSRRSIVLEGPDGLLGGGSDPAAAAGGSGSGQNSLVSVPSSPPPPPLSRLAALKWEDIEDRRILLHVDLSAGVVEGEVEGGGPGLAVGGAGVSVAEGNANAGGGVQPQPFPEAVRLVAEQVREILSAKPAAVAIVSEMAPPSAAAAAAAAAAAEKDAEPPDGQVAPFTVDPDATKSEEDPSPASGVGGAAQEEATYAARPGEPASVSLRPSAAAIASLLGMEVDFYNSVPDLAAALGQCAEGGGPRTMGDGSGGGGGGGDSRRAGGGSLTAFGVPLMMVERLSLPGVVPAPPVEEPELSDGEEERLPDFSWGGEGVMLTVVHVCGKRPRLEFRAVTNKWNFCLFWCGWRSGWVGFAFCFLWGDSDDASITRSPISWYGLD